MSRFKLCRSLLLLVALALTAAPAQADCSNPSSDGITWACTSGTTVSQINTRLGTASDGATFTFASGSYSWSSTIVFSATKALALICASSCSVSSSGTVLGWPNGTNSSKAYRVSGFTFTHSSGTFLWTCPGGNCPAMTIQSFRFDHNTMNVNAGQPWMLLGEGSAGSGPHWIYGVIDHNTFTQSVTTNFITTSGVVPNSPPTRTLGQGTNGAKNLFIEDNTFTTASYNNSGAGMIDNDGGGMSFVVRFNTLTNSRILSHGTKHAWGIANFEVYGNIIQYNSGCQDSTGICDGYHMIHHQGSGLYMTFGNRLTNKPGTTRHTGSAIVSMDVGSQDNRPQGAGICNGSSSFDGNRSGGQGYPCERQIARDIDDVLFPVFAWDNRWTSDNAIQRHELDDAYGGALAQAHLVENRDFYNYTASFTGASGMGVGTLVNRPASCTVGPQAGVGQPDQGRGGVGYWATDQGSWKTATPTQGNPNVENGVLYMCTATNTWSAYYTPYQYPHPLVSGGAAPDTTPPAPPTGVTISSLAR